MAAVILEDMALTYTPAAHADFTLPPFSLNTVEGETFDSSQLDGRAILIAFICNHCPYVKAIEDRLLALAREFGPKGMSTVAICANDPTDHPDDAPAALLARSREKNYGFPYLVDATQDVARAFGAVCTPDFFLFGEKRKLAYRGRLDDSWRDASRVQTPELARAITALLRGETPSATQNPSMGCSIKWVAP